MFFHRGRNWFRRPHRQSIPIEVLSPEEARPGQIVFRARVYDPSLKRGVWLRPFKTKSVATKARRSALEGMVRPIDDEGTQT